MHRWLISAIAGSGLLLSACGSTTSLQSPQTGGLTGGLSAGAGADETTKTTFNPFQDETTSTTSGRRQVIAHPTIEQVMKVGALPEMSMGRADAPVTIIKYASLTCPYCRQFQLETFPALKREFIDTGKVRFIIREFPIGFQSGAATVALRCAPASKYFELYAKFLSQQSRWVSQEVRHDPIFAVARQVGLSRQKFDACYADKALVENLKWVKDRGRTLGVIGTPNFFVNGKLYKRVLTMNDIRGLITQELARPVASRS